MKLTIDSLNTSTFYEMGHLHISLENQSQRDEILEWLRANFKVGVGDERLNFDTVLNDHFLTRDRPVSLNIYIRTEFRIAHEIGDRRLPLEVEEDLWFDFVKKFQSDFDVKFPLNFWLH